MSDSQIIWFMLLGNTFETRSNRRVPNATADPIMQWKNQFDERKQD